MNRRSTTFILALLFGAAFISSCGSQNKTFSEIAWEESAIPVRPGKPGEVPFWNHYAFRFIYAPAFDYDNVDGAVEYRYDLFSEADSTTYSFTDTVPYSPLSPIWCDVPVGYFDIKVTGISADGEDLGLAGEGRYWRASPFNGEYHTPPVMPYDESARIALDTLMNKYWVQSWLKEPTTHPDYTLYRYPTKILSALIIGAITHSRLHEGESVADSSKKIAVTVADYLLGLRFEPGTYWEYHTPTYKGYWIGQRKGKNHDHMQEYNIMTIYGVDAGNAWLDLYDFTGDEKYLDAAKRVAQTFVKRQLPNGSWYLYVNHETNEPYVDLIVIPTQIINYYDRLADDYGVEGLDESKRRALEWIENNTLKTFDWQGQFEDIKPRAPYQNLSREQACDYANYLMKYGADKQENIDLAEELIRFAEDQFVIWEQPIPKVINKNSTHPVHSSWNWITPSVQEQYVFWMPVGRSAAIMIDTFWQAYLTTGKEIYLAKAKSIANSFTVMQKANNGDYNTFFIDVPFVNYWLNSVVYPAKTMMKLQNALDSMTEAEN